MPTPVTVFRYESLNVAPPVRPTCDANATAPIDVWSAAIPVASRNALSFRVGQQAADVEFFDSQTDDLFINGTFGWPANKANNLPSGGPAPPIAVPGIRVKATLSDQVTVFGAVFNGNAARPGDGDPQLRDNHGLAFRVNDPPWLIGQEVSHGCIRMHNSDVIDLYNRARIGTRVTVTWSRFGGGTS